MTFEQQVGAYRLAQLLVRAVPPVLVDSTVTEVSFQTERFGWQTDDFLVVSKRAGAPARKLAGQVNRIRQLRHKMIACHDAQKQKRNL